MHTDPANPALSRIFRGYSARCSVRSEGNEGTGNLAAGVAFPMVADFVAFYEFRRNGGDHQVSTVRTARRRGEGTDSGEPRPTFMKLHVHDFPFLPFRGGQVAVHRGKEATL